VPASQFIRFRHVSTEKYLQWVGVEITQVFILVSGDVINLEYGSICWKYNIWLFQRGGKLKRSNNWRICSQEGAHDVYFFFMSIQVIKQNYLKPIQVEYCVTMLYPLRYNVKDYILLKQILWGRAKCCTFINLWKWIHANQVYRIHKFAFVSQVCPCLTCFLFGFHLKLRDGSLLSIIHSKWLKRKKP
jgi:hypothetical protein